MDVSFSSSSLSNDFNKDHVITTCVLATSQWRGRWRSTSNGCSVCGCLLLWQVGRVYYLFRQSK